MNEVCLCGCDQVGPALQATRLGDLVVDGDQTKVVLPAEVVTRHLMCNARFLPEVGTVAGADRVASRITFLTGEHFAGVRISVCDPACFGFSVISFECNGDQVIGV